MAQIIILQALESKNRRVHQGTRHKSRYDTKVYDGVTTEQLPAPTFPKIKRNPKEPSKTDRRDGEPTTTYCNNNRIKEFMSGLKRIRDWKVNK